MMDSDTVRVATSNNGSRKKKKLPNKREQARRDRYRDPDPEPSELPPKCVHKEGPHACSKITLPDLKMARKRIYAGLTRKDQDRTIACYLVVNKPKRSRKRGSNKSKPRGMQVTYQLSTVGNGLVCVCQKLFLKALGMGKSKRRVTTIAHAVFEGKLVTENRGGDRKSSKSIVKKDKVRDFIGNLRGRESHYNRAKSKRIYQGERGYE